VALQGFEGGLVVVSHDRHLIKTVADTLWLVADGKLKVFDGDLDDYQQWLKTRAKADQSQSKPKDAKKPPRDSLGQLRRELTQIERRIAANAAEQATMNASVADPANEKRLADKRARLTRDAALLESRWMEVGIAIETAEAQASDG
jgi:ATP-binding cassette, subfamily F, member 3